MQQHVLFSVGHIIEKLQRPVEFLDLCGRQVQHGIADLVVVVDATDLASVVVQSEEGNAYFFSLCFKSECYCCSMNTNQ